MFFFVLTVLAGSVFGIGDVAVHSVDYSVTAGEYNNGSGIINSVRVNYSMEWSEIDSGGWHTGECCWDFMGALHLAWAYRDSSGVGSINPVYCVWMQNESGNRWPCEFGTCFSFRGLDTLNFQIIDQDTFVIKERHWSSSGTILLPMPIGNLRIYLVGDELRWDRIYGEPNITEFCGGFGCPRINEFASLNDYFAGNLGGQIHVLEERDVTIPQPAPQPPPMPGIEFVDWLTSADTTGKNWLPVPGDTIGLKFSLTSEIQNTDHRMTFLIWDISSWQGQAMNYPAPPVAAPWHTGAWFRKITAENSNGSDFDFDFWLAHPELYDVQVIDTLTQIDMYDQFSATGWQHALDTLRARDLAGQAIRRSRKSIIARTRQPVTGSHTLELISRDYAAHCMVTPFVDAAGKSNFMSRTTSLGDTISYVSVPRDEDGFEQYSGNTGDFLADAWEEKVFPGTDLRKNWPFGHPDSLADSTLLYEDDDHDFVGRAIDGDDLLNFEEYRGFLVAADSTQPHDTTNYEHIRCEPGFKDVFVYFHPALEINPMITVFNDVYPGFLTLLSDSIHLHLTDFSKIYSDTAVVDSLSLRRPDKDVSFQRASATTLYIPNFIPNDSIRYFGLPLELNMYANGNSYAQVISVWPSNRFQGTTARNPGWTRAMGPGKFEHPSDPHGHGTFPGNTWFIILNFEFFEDVHDNSIVYRQFSNVWNSDLTKALRRTLTHELGHAVGLTHPQSLQESDTLTMGKLRIVDGRFDIPEPGFSTQDRSRFTVRGR